MKKPVLAIVAIVLILGFSILANAQDEAKIETHKSWFDNLIGFFKSFFSKVFNVESKEPESLVNNSENKTEKKQESTEELQDEFYRYRECNSNQDCVIASLSCANTSKRKVAINVDYDDNILQEQIAKCPTCARVDQGFGDTVYECVEIYTEGVICKDKKCYIKGEEPITPIKGYECLNDSQCNDTSICLNYSCKELLGCEFPLYPANHKCIGKKCINDSDCNSNQICYFYQKECIKLDCGLKEYAENHTCKKYQCFTNTDCNGAECFYHKCIGIPNYIPFETKEIGNTRTNGKKILNYSILRNFDIGLFIAQTQEELDNLNNTIIPLNNVSIDFSQNIALLVVEHGLNPADVKFHEIMQKDNSIYIRLIAEDNKTGIIDDAWHLIALKRENFTEKDNLEFRITPTGKMIILGEQMLTGIHINYPSTKKGEQYLCVNQTINEEDTGTVTFLDKSYSIEIRNIEVYRYEDKYKLYASISVDGGAVESIEENTTKKIGNLGIYIAELHHLCKEGCWGYAQLGICYEE